LLNFEVNPVSKTDIGCVQDNGRGWDLLYLAPVLVTKKRKTLVPMGTGELASSISLLII
jgi:hypothetical protein